MRISAADARWVARLLRRSIRFRAARFASGAVAAATAAAVMVAGIALSRGLKERLGADLASYGANAIVSSPVGRLDASFLERIRRLDGVASAAPQIYASGRIGAATVEVVGLEPSSAGAGGRLSGGPPGGGSAVVGARLARALPAAPGAPLALTVSGRTKTFAVSGVVETGSSRDRSVFLSLDDLRALTGVEGFGAILVRAAPGELERVGERVRSLAPGLLVRTLSEVAAEEEAFLGRMELLAVLGTLVVLIGAGVAMSGTMNAVFAERTAEIGLVRALGARRRVLVLLYLAESGAFGLAGGLTGLAAGGLAAAGISSAALGAPASIPPWSGAAAAVLGAALAVAATAVPLRRALGRSTVFLLRGA